MDCEETSTRKKSKTALGLPVRSFASIVLAVIFLLLYLIRPYATEAITIWPSWIWFLPGVLLANVFSRKLFWKAIRWPLVAWLVVSIFCSEVKRMPLLLPLIEVDSESSWGVVSLNVAGYMKEGIVEMSEEGASVMLVQESAIIGNLEEYVGQVLGDDYRVVEGMDCSVIVNGEILETDTSATNCTIVKAVVWDRPVLIVSVRMQPIWPRLDYWNPACWKSYAEHRKSHEIELAEIWEHVQQYDDGSPIIFGGDFNAVPDRKFSQVFDGKLKDSYAEKGGGWYGTALTEMPFFRIDQIWVGQGVHTMYAKTSASAVSDHRMAITYFAFDKY